MLFLALDGQVLAGGCNAFGQLGNGTRRDSGTAVVTFPTTVPLRGLRVAAGEFFSAAICEVPRYFVWLCVLRGS